MVVLPEQPLGPGDRVLAGFSVAFDASCEEMWLAWRNGACLVPAPRLLVRSGVDLCPWLVERGVTVVSTVPTLAALWPSDGLSGVRLLILGGEACPPELATRFLSDDREVWNTYGPTETTVVACAWRMVRDDTVRIGLPLDGWTLAVVDAEGAPVRWGEVGELAISGVGVARYLDAANDAGRFTPSQRSGRAYLSGDLVRADSSGLVFVGRKDEQVKIRGYRVEPSEVAAALSAHSSVRQAHVRVVDDDNGKRLVAYAVLDDDAVEVAELRRYLTAKLPAAMIPDFFVLLGSMPVTTSGKVDVRALPPPVSEVRHVTGTPVTTEDLIAAIWCEVLGVPEVGLDDSFFDIGGHSLLVARVRDRLAETGRPIPAVAMFSHPTVRRLAGYLKDADDGAEEVPSGPRRQRPRQWRDRLVT
nr:non-ribosomal peptide synthetase [Kibdelosporangium phytohabitans]